MNSTRDQLRAAALIIVVVLTAATFAGFSFGTTAPSRNGQAAAAPLLLQPTTHTVRANEDCQRRPARAARQANAVTRPEHEA